MTPPSRQNGPFNRQLAVLAGLLLIVAGVWYTAYVGRADLARAGRAACQAEILDRLDSINVLLLQARADQAIANDPSQTPPSRLIRRLESGVEYAAVTHLRLRVDPAHGGKLDCKRLFPRANLLAL